MYNIINKKLIALILIFTWIIPINIYAADLNLPSSSLTQTNNIPSDAYNPSTGETVTTQGEGGIGATTSTLFGGGTGSGGLPAAAQEQAQKMVESINTGSAESNLSQASSSSTCTCPVVWDVLCSLQCFIADIFSYVSLAAISSGTAILGSVIDQNNSLGLGYTPNDNFIIAVGWNVVRNVANAALVIGLVIIAITIILGLQENKSKKLLITFILIALLINFTPVICEFVINGANIMMNSFLTGGVASDFYQTGIHQAFKAVKGTPDFTTRATVSIVLLVFSIMFFIILLLYALLFLIRNIVLWILIIVSPIAFATKVFPEFRHITKLFPSVLYWDEWWDAFWQWCVIGIPAGLSIYLANQMLAVLANQNELKAVLSMTTVPAGGFASILTFLIAYMTPFAFLLGGFFISISSGGKAGSYVGGLATGMFTATAGRAIGWGKEKAKEGGEWAIGGAGKFAAGTIAGGTGGMMSGMMEEYAKKDATMGSVLSATAKGTMAGAFTRRGQEEGANYWKRTAAETAVDAHIASPDKLFKLDAAARKQAEEQVKDMDFDDVKQYQTYAPRLSAQAKAVALEKYMEKGPDILTKVSEKERGEMVGLIKQYGSKTTQKNALMSLAGKGNNDDLAKSLGFDMTDIQAKHGSANEMIINKFNSKDGAKYLSDDFISNPENLAKMNSNHFSYIAQEKGRKGVTIVEKNIDMGTVNPKTAEWFKGGRGAASVYDFNRPSALQPQPAQPQSNQPQQTTNAPGRPLQQGGAPGRPLQQGGAPGRPLQQGGAPGRPLQ